MNASDTNASPTSFYVGSAARIPGKTTYTVVTDYRIGSTAKIVMGYVSVERGNRTYLTQTGDESVSPAVNAQLAAAVDHYEEWAAKH